MQTGLLLSSAVVHVQRLNNGFSVSVLLHLSPLAFSTKNEGRYNERKPGTRLAEGD